MEKLKGKLFLIVGPSGVGKGTVIALLKAKHPEYIFPISATTRQPRPGEKEGQTYYFVTKERFNEMIENDELLEYAIVHNKEYYGPPKKPILEALENDKIIIREVDMQGCESIIKVLPKENLVSIFLTVPDKQDLIDRILKRGKLPEEEIKRRMQSAEKEFAKGGRICDYQVPSLTGKVDQCVREVEIIIQKESKK